MDETWRDSSEYQPVVMASGRCQCGKRPEHQCPAEKVAMVRIYYCVRRTAGEKSPLRVEQTWWCLSGDATELTIESVARMIDPPAQQRAMGARSTTLGPVSANSSRLGPDADMFAHVREATGTYLTDRIDTRLGAIRLDDQLWESSRTFIPGEAARTLDLTNNSINDAVSGAMREAFVSTGMPIDPAGIISGITADLVLAPVSEPIGEAKKIIELVGLCIAVVTLQPALAVACAKALIHEEIKDLIDKAISEIMGPHETVTTVTSKATPATDSPASISEAQPIGMADATDTAVEQESNPVLSALAGLLAEANRRSWPARVTDDPRKNSFVNRSSSTLGTVS